MADPKSKPVKRIKQIKKQKSFALEARVGPRPSQADYFIGIVYFGFKQLKVHWLWFYLIAGSAVVIISWLFVGFSGGVDLVNRQAELSLLEGQDFWSNVLVNYQLTVILIDDLLTNRTPGSHLGWLTFFILSIISLIVFNLARNLEQKRTSWKSFFDSCLFGPSQIVPYVLTLILILFQILPAFVFNNVFVSLADNQILTGPESQMLMLILFFLFNLFSLYLVAGSIFGLIIVSLPGCRPFNALRSSWSVSQGRRGAIGRHIFGLGLILLILTFVVMIPSLYFLPRYSEFIFYFWVVLALSYSHLCLYRLYSQLIVK